MLRKISESPGRSAFPKPARYFRDNQCAASYGFLLGVCCCKALWWRSRIGAISCQIEARKYSKISFPQRARKKHFPYSFIEVTVTMIYSLTIKEIIIRDSLWFVEQVETAW